MNSHKPEERIVADGMPFNGKIYLKDIPNRHQAGRSVLVGYYWTNDIVVGEFGPFATLQGVKVHYESYVKSVTLPSEPPKYSNNVIQIDFKARKRI